jgi:hypothetical protein
VNRETILTALFALVSTLPGLITKSRRPLHWSAVPREQQPALFMGAGDQDPTNDPSGVPVVWTLKAQIYLYVQSPDPSVPPSIVLNGYLDQLEKMVGPQANPGPWGQGFQQTLGGLVKHVWIDGAITTSGDLLGDQGIAIIPLSILVN